MNMMKLKNILNHWDKFILKIIKMQREMQVCLGMILMDGIIRYSEMTDIDRYSLKLMF